MAACVVAEQVPVPKEYNGDKNKKIVGETARLKAEGTGPVI